MIFFRNRLIFNIVSTLCFFSWLGLAEVGAREMGSVPQEDNDNILQISDFAWTDAIDLETRNPKNRFANGGTVPKGPLYLWMKVRGEKRALEKLMQDHKLPIRHKWFRYIGTRPYFDSTKEPTDAIESTDTIDLLSMDRHEVLSELNTELNNQGFFEWRVWSGKQEKDVRIGWWRVDVVYADNKPVLCGKDPCSYNILVKN